MNIIEAYINFKNQLIIIISGIAGCGKNKLARNISENFNIKLLKQYDYIKSDFSNKVTIQDNMTVNNFNTDDAFDWDRFNSDINKYKKSGVVITGISFPKDILEFNADYHIHLSISKQECVKRKHKYLEKNKDTHKDEYALIGTPLEMTYMNKLIFPYYLESIKKMHINKFLKGTGLSDEKIWDSSWDILIQFIQTSVNDFANSKQYAEWKKKNLEKKNKL